MMDELKQQFYEVIAHVALAHRRVRLVGGIPPQLVQIGIDVRLAGE